MRHEVWAEVQATPGFQEITGTPTVRRLEFSGEDLDSALRAADEAKGKPEVLWATVEVAEGESGEEYERLSSLCSRPFFLPLFTNCVE